MRLASLLFTLYVFGYSLLAHAQQDNLLSSCNTKMDPADRTLLLVFSNSRHELYHSFEPWQTLDHKLTGALFTSGSKLTILDTLLSRSKTYPGVHQFRLGSLLLQDFGDTALTALTRDEYYEELIATAAYTPCFLTRYAATNADRVTSSLESSFRRYRFSMGDEHVSILVKQSDTLIHTIEVLKADDLYGDVLTTYRYEGYSTTQGIPVPRIVYSDKTNGKVIDTVRIASASLTDLPVPTPLSSLTGFEFKEETRAAPTARFTRFNEHLGFVELPHIAARALVVEFKDHLVVTTAPLSAENGEIIIDEIKRAIPQKPITQFIVGHSCPWGIGGLRAFVHEGASIRCRRSDLEYADYLTNAPHSLHPDLLEKDRKPLKTEVVGDSVTLTDGAYSVKVFYIGAKSAHTADYLMLYFPQEKIVWNDDLAWIPEDGAIRKAGKRQAGLYGAIEDLNLDVATVLQSWPTAGYHVKTSFAFSDLEASVRVK